MNGDSKPRTRRSVLKYLGSGALVSTAGVYGLRQSTQPASASVALAFDDADVDVPEDKSIEDLRLTGEVTGDYNSGSEDLEVVNFSMDVEFDDFGSFSDSKNLYPGQREGTVSWQPSHSLVEKTDFNPDTHVSPTNMSADHISYDATVQVRMDVLGKDAAAIIAEAQTGDTATITFHEPDSNTEIPDDGNGGGGTEEDTPSASVEITFGFEVDK